MKKQFKRLNRFLRTEKDKIVKTLSDIHMKVLIGIVLIGILFFDVYLQFQINAYERKENNIKEEINNIKTKIKVSKEKEAVLKEEIATNITELTELNKTLETLKQDLETANKKLEELK